MVTHWNHFGILGTDSILLHQCKSGVIPSFSVDLIQIWISVTEKNLGLKNNYQGISRHITFWILFPMCFSVILCFTALCYWKIKTEGHFLPSTACLNLFIACFYLHLVLILLSTVPVHCLCKRKSRSCIINRACTKPLHWIFQCFSFLFLLILLFFKASKTRFFSPLYFVVAANLVPLVEQSI